MEFKNIVFNEEKQMGFITLNRPDVYNALNHPLFVELNEGGGENKNRFSDTGAHSHRRG